MICLQGALVRATNDHRAEGTSTAFYLLYDAPVEQSGKNVLATILEV